MQLMDLDALQTSQVTNIQLKSLVIYGTGYSTIQTVIQPQLNGHHLDGFRSSEAILESLSLNKNTVNSY